MSIYAVAAIGLVVMFVIGALSYGVIGKNALKDIQMDRSVLTLVIALVAMYLTSLAFVVLYRDVSFASGVSGLARGLELGLWVGLPFAVTPTYVDRHYFVAKGPALGIFLANWLVTFLVLGLV